MQYQNKSGKSSLAGFGFGSRLRSDAGLEALEHRLAMDASPTALLIAAAGSDGPSDPTEVGGIVVFEYGDSTSGRELWRTDGTPGGTRLLKDILPGPRGSSPQIEMVAGGLLYFSADDGVHGEELWRTDGTELGTVMVRDINPHGGSWAGSLGADTGLAFFEADDGTHGRELWVTDGTQAGTHLVKDVRPGPQGAEMGSSGALGNVFYFEANDGIHGSELWFSDGTEAGTRLVADLNPEGDSTPSPVGLVSGGRALVGANDGAFGQELWVTDGTERGTRLVADIYRGEGSSEPEGGAVIGNATLFSADDGQRGIELWRSDGTASGTRLVKEAIPGSEGSSLPFFPTNLGAGQAIFPVVTGGSAGGMWRTDGTSAGTFQLAHLAFDTRSGGAAFEGGGRSYFEANDGVHGFELWVTDGTVGGTRLVADLASGQVSSSPSEGAVSGNDVIWVARNSQGQDVLWVVRNETPAPDLTATVIDGGLPTSVLQGEPLRGRVSVDIRNSGDAPTSSAATIGVSLFARPEGGGPDVLVASVSNFRLGGLSPGAVKRVQLPVALTSGLPTGSFRIVAMADTGGAVIERNETNNAGISAGSIVAAPAFRDLGATLGPVTMAQAVVAGGGSKAVATIQIANRGNVALLRGQTVEVRLVAVPEGDGEPILLGAVSKVLGGLKPGASKAIKLSTLIGASVPEGTYRVYGAVVDAGIEERTDGFRDLVVAAPFVDLRVTLGTSSVPASAEVGTLPRIRQSVSILNSGNVSVGSNRSVLITSYARPEGQTDGSQDIVMTTLSVNISGVKPGKAKAVSLQYAVPANVAAGRYVFGVRVDTSAVGDVRTDNDGAVGSAVLALTPGQPRLTTTFWESPTSFALGNFVNMSDEYTNLGRGASAELSVVYYLSYTSNLEGSHVSVGERRVRSLAPGESSFASTRLDTARVSSVAPVSAYIVSTVRGTDGELTILHAERIRITPP